MRHLALKGGVIALALLLALASMAQRPVFVSERTGLKEREVRKYSTAAIERDLRKIKSVVPLKPTGPVLRIIHRYLYENRPRTEEMLGRAYLYFPMMEQLLREHNAPEELKYLAVIESSLKPNATSPVGARGIWQFMEETGREYGLLINDVVDERLDPEKSTIAAIKYLQHSNDRFKSWTLALAAYNSGGGRVNRAVRRAHSKNFWRLKRFLPRETRSYVPAYIAASYILNHYDEYGLEPVFPERDLYLKTKIKLRETTRFEDLAGLLEVNASTLYALNPQYYRGIVPAGWEFFVPQRCMHIVEDFFYPETPEIKARPSFLESMHYVKAGESIWDIALRYRCTPEVLMEWNGLTSTALEEGTGLIIYQPSLVRSQVPRYSMRKTVRSGAIGVLEELPTLRFSAKLEKHETPATGTQVPPTRMRRTKLKKFTIRKTTSLYDMANWLGVDVGELINLNKELVKKGRLTPGTVIRVPGN